MRKVLYKGIMDPRSVGFHKRINVIKERVEKRIEIRVQVRCIRTRLMVYADEKKAGFEIGDFIRRDNRGNLERYKGLNGYSTLVLSKLN
jgi:hypothetical protein